jgi:hypothetical protein
MQRSGPSEAVGYVRGIRRSVPVGDQFERDDTYADETVCALVERGDAVTGSADVRARDFSLDCGPLIRTCIRFQSASAECPCVH